MKIIFEGTSEELKNFFSEENHFTFIKPETSFKDDEKTERPNPPSGGSGVPDKYESLEKMFGNVFRK